MRKIITLSLLSVLGGCSQQATPSGVSDGLVVNQHDQTTLDATYNSAGQSLHMTSIEISSKVVDITFDFGANVVAYRLDYGVGEGDFISNGRAFDAAEILLVEQLLKALPSVLPADPSQYSSADNAALHQTNLLSEAPIGQLVASFHFVAERGWTHIGCGCSNQYNGHGTYSVGGTGCGCTGGSGNGCKGRCGVGCGNGGYPAYTQDCLCHDYGLCSWTTASDDFSFAGANCGYVSGCT